MDINVGLLVLTHWGIKEMEREKIVSKENGEKVTMEQNDAKNWKQKMTPNG